MTAGTLRSAQESSGHNQQQMRAGYTSISSGTLQRLLVALAADAFNVPHGDVRAGISDEQGQVSVSLAVPLALHINPDLAAVGLSTKDGGTIFERAATARSVVAERFHCLTGSAVGTVNVRFTGLHQMNHANAGRVR